MLINKHYIICSFYSQKCFVLRFLQHPKNVLVCLSSNFMFYSLYIYIKIYTHTHTHKVKLFGVISDSSSNFAYLRLTSRKKTFFMYLLITVACRNTVMLPGVVSHFLLLFSLILVALSRHMKLCEDVIWMKKSWE